MNPEFTARLFLGLSALLAGGGAVLFLLGRRREASLALLGALITAAGFFLIRSALKAYFPFTDKAESFATLYWLLIGAVLLYRRELAGGESFAIIVTAIASAAVALFLFTAPVKYPSPYLRTIWYPLHVPLSFAAYAFWITAGIRSAGILFRDEGDRGLTADQIRNGFLIFSFAMVCGGIWGYLAWGAYFLWDPKVVWSVILWVFYGNQLHIDGIPSFKRWKHPLNVVGILLILITFIGTGFFTRSIHRF